MKQLDMFAGTPKKKAVVKKLPSPVWEKLPPVKLQPLKKVKRYMVTGWRLEDELSQKLRAAQANRKRDTRPIFILAANLDDFYHFCFIKAIEKATSVQHPGSFGNLQPGEVRVMLTPDSWKHPMWSVLGEYLCAIS